jgi:hypothetical protein
MTREELKGAFASPVKQGRCIVEVHKGYCMVMFPDGGVESTRTRKSAESRCRKWFAGSLGSAQVGIGSVEYRDCTNR